MYVIFFTQSAGPLCACAPNNVKFTDDRRSGVCVCVRACVRSRYSVVCTVRGPFVACLCVRTRPPLYSVVLCVCERRVAFRVVESVVCARPLRCRRRRFVCSSSSPPGNVAMSRRWTSPCAVLYLPAYDIIIIYYNITIIIYYYSW